MKKVFLMPLAIIAILLVVSPAAMADDMYCENMVLRGEYDNVIVPYGYWCVMDGAELTGNFQAEGAKAIVIWRSSIAGNIQIRETMEVPSKQRLYDMFKVTKNQILSNRVGGDVQLTENRAGFAIKANTVHGNIQVEKSCMKEKRGVDIRVKNVVAINGNRVSGDLQFFENCSDYEYGKFKITGNRVEGNLQCDNNYPAPIYRRNEVNGDTQCYTSDYECESCLGY